MYYLNGRELGTKVVRDRFEYVRKPAPNFESDISGVQAEVLNKERIIRSYGLHPNQIPGYLGDFLISRGEAQKNEFVCIECYKIFTISKTKHRKCETCRRIRHD